MEMTLKQRIETVLHKPCGFRYQHSTWDRKLWTKSKDNIKEYLLNRFHTTLDEVEYYIEKRKWTSIDNISENIIYATLAVEDRNFEHHWGINVFTIFRAIVKDLIKMKKKEGGSTITQQLATDMFLSKRNKTFFRKIQNIHK